jgi:hypothetical protein
MKKNSLVAVLLSLAAQLSAQSPSAGNFVLGKTETIDSKILGEKRVLNIYLPDGYSPDSAATYPVIYVLDGSANEDFVHIAGLLQFMNMYQLAPNSIVVGIANVDRRRDFTYPTTIERDKKDFPTTGHSEAFMDFIEKELQPFVGEHYHARTIIGQSLGALLATELLLKRPKLFNRYIIVSPSLWWDNESLLNAAPQLLEQNKPANTDVFIAVGKEGKVMEGDVHRLAAVLKKYNGNGMRIFTGEFPDENHATILHRAVYRAFELFYGKKK